MFSGIIESMATVIAIEKDQNNIHFTFNCPFGHELAPAQSLAHNGVCLTIVSVNGDQYITTAMKETLDRSNLGELKVGDEVTIEFGNGTVGFRVLSIAQSIRKEDADSMYETL